MVRSAMMVGLSLALGCSFVNDLDDHRPGGGLEPIAAEAFCAEVAQIMCEGHVDCCPMPSVEVDPCVTDLTRKCSDRLGGILLDPRTGYDARVAAEVSVEGRGYTSSCDSSLASWAGDRTGLLRVLRGTVEPGGECTPEGWLDFAAAYSCEDLGQGCVSGAAGRSYCVDLGREGDTCRTNDDCLGAFYCEGFMPFVSEGTCMPELPNGAACDESTDCQSLVCEGGMCRPLNQESLYCALPNVFGD